MHGMNRSLVRACGLEQLSRDLAGARAMQAPRGRHLCDARFVEPRDSVAVSAQTLGRGVQRPGDRLKLSDFYPERVLGDCLVNGVHGERSLGCGIIHVSRDKMRVQMGHRVPEQLVVHLGRPVTKEQRLSHHEELSPIGTGFRLGELERFGDVSPSPHSDRVAAGEDFPLEVGVQDFSGEETKTEA